jgi:predicted DNA-binding transcriptional regulator YafY
MANYKLLKRLERIIYYINNRPGISKADLLQRLLDQTDNDVSERTLERDFTILKTDYGLDIYYDRSKKGYLLSDDPERLGTFFKFAELASLAELYEAGLKDYQTFQKWVILDDSAAFKGLHNIKKVLSGITKSQKLSFEKINYYENTRKTYTVSPLRLKEYLNRWYLIAVPDNLDEIRTFGLDRLENISLLPQKAKKIKNETEQLQQFLDVIGLNYTETKEVQKVVLKADNRQIKYLRSLPLHHSQLCIEGENEKEWGTVMYELKPNFEFETQILKLGFMVEVLKPVWFREKIAAHIQTMNKLYN